MRNATMLLAVAGISLSGCASQEFSSRPIAGMRANSTGEVQVFNALAATSLNDAVFFVDGAGGGGLIIDWSREIRRGLRDAGFRGQFRPFVWQMGFGPISDECASVNYKREKALRLLTDIRTFRQSHPHGRIHLISASAGTAVGVFALEAMDEDERVDSFILLASALSSTYDLTSALKHVGGQVHVFTSRKDALLRIVMPMLGTSDREFVHAHVIGLEGVVRSADASAAAEYAKIREFPWRSDWTTLGNAGGHTDSMSRAFVREIVAPLLLSDPALASSGLSTRLRSLMRTAIEPDTKSSTLKE